MKTAKLSQLVTFKYFKSDDKALNLMKQSINAILIHPDEHQAMYDQFGADLKLFTSKVGSSPAKTAVQDLLNRKIIFIVRHLSKTKSGIFGGCFFNKNSLVGIGLDLMELDIDRNTGKTNSIDDCFYACYFHYIRSSVLLNTSKVKSNTKLHADLVTFMYYLMLKIIKFNVLPKQKTLLLIVSSYFFHRFLLGLNHTQSLSKTYAITDNALKDEIVHLVKVLESYTKIEDIFKAVIDFKIANDAPAKLIMRALTTLKPAAFYSMTTSLDYFIALAVVSKYPFGILSNAISMNKLQSNIESQITPYVTSVKFDIDYINKNVRK